jgi:hypothetical protein
MSEKNGAYWTKVKPMLSGWDPQRVENSAGLGTPDVNHKHGWIELKYVEAWPVRPDTPLRVSHYTAVQKTWHLRRCMAGGRCHVLIGVGSDSVLLDGRVAHDYLGELPKDKLIEVALAYWAGGIGMKEGLKRAILED